MRVLFDNQIFSLQEYGGISKYFCQIISHFDERVRYSLPIKLSNNAHLDESNLTIFSHFFPNHRFIGKTSFIKQVNKLKILNELKKSDFDIFHPTYYDPYFLSQVKKKPFILTIHDMTHEKFSLHTPYNDWTVKGKRILAQSAAKIIAVSHNTKKDIIHYLGIDEQKIEVIYHGSDLEQFPVNSYSLNLPEKYILFVGSRCSYKNFSNFITAFSALSAKDKDLRVICTGPPLVPEEIKLLASLKIFDKVRHMRLTDQQLSEVYKRAELFVFPSKYEGFGIPILESFANNCPVVLSEISCFPEIAGDAGYYFDPFSVDSIYAAIDKVLYDNSLKKHLIEKGKIRIKQFTWKQASSQTYSVYRSIIDNE